MKNKIYKFDHNVDTDAIMPARFLNNNNPTEYKMFCFADLSPTFAQQVCAGDVIVAGRHFGCGSSRESAPMALKALGIKCVLAESYSRIFLRNSINIGLPAIQIESELYNRIKNHSEIKYDDQFTRFEIHVDDDVVEIAVQFSSFIREIINNGGLIEAYNNGCFHYV